MSLSSTFKALSDPTRREILHILKDTDLSAGDLADRFEITFPTLSHHLSILKESGLVSARKQGQQQIYSLNLSVLEEVLTSYFDHFK
ncbi:MAG: autorepressor SdpR family transcription factor [Candidatus Komeilibacteria bacterium]|nr:autorepressor SdpR family transcription factor [Candidatus Komeilibacteria bacterium]